MLSALAATPCTLCDAGLFKQFMRMAWNNNIAQIAGTWSQAEQWLELVNASRMDTYGNMENWGRFYAYVKKNQHPLWSHALLGKFYAYGR